MNSPFFKVFLSCLLLWLCSRLILLGTALGLHAWMHSSIPLPSLFGILDSTWYLSIVTEGYDVVPRAFTHHANYVFFPLFPLLIKLCSIICHLSPLIAGYIVSNGCFLGALILFRQWLAAHFDVKTVQTATWLLAFSPYNVYFMAIYTESLALLLMLACWIAAEKRAWKAAATAGFLLALSHPNGVLMLFPLLWFVYDEWEQGGAWKQAWPILCIPLGLLVYMAYLYVHTGDALAFAHNMRAWHRPGWSWADFVPEVMAHAEGQAYNLMMYFIGIGFSFFLWRRGYAKEAMIMPLFTVMALGSGSFVSLARYTATLFPFYLAYALLVQGSLYRWGFVVLNYIGFGILSLYWFLESPQIY